MAWISAPVVRLVLCLAAAAVAAGGAARAAEVTQQDPAIQQRTDSRLPVPVSLTTLSSTQLESAGISSLESIAVAIPDVVLTPSLNSSNTPILYMRGQGLDNPSQITRDSAVGVYEDGFYVARPQALMFDMPDLDRVEVLRGPQGGLYGRDTTGGVINLLSNAPAGELRFRQSADFGNRNLFRVAASLDAPRWHDVSARVALLASSIDGYVKNPLPNSHSYGEERQRGGRLTLHWDGFSNVRADYFLEKSDVDSTPAYDTNPYLNGNAIYSFFFPYYANPNGPTTTSYRPIDLPLSTSTHLAHGLTLAWEPNEAFAVKSLTGYRSLSADAKQDYAEFLGLANTTDDRYGHHQFSQDLQFSGDLLSRQLGYLAGVSYFKEGGSHDRAFRVLTQGRTIKSIVFAETRSEAAYIQLHWQPRLLGRRVELTAAARYTKDTKDAERFETDTFGGTLENGAASGAVNHLSYRRLNPTSTLGYRWTRNISTYATVSRGYRAGGALESAPVGQFGSSTFRPEGLLTYEVGVKSAFWGHRLSAELAAFSAKERDVQYAIPVDAVTDQVYSLQKATIHGVDLSLQGTPLKDLVLSARVAFLHWTIDQADVLPGTVLDPASGSGSPYVVGQNIKNLFALPYTPKYNFTVAGDYTFLRLYHRELSAHVDYVYRGQFYSDPAAGPDVPGRQFDTTPAVGLLNARLVLAQEIDWSHHIRVSLWGRNVLNRKYYQLAGGYGSGISQFQTSGTAAPVGWIARAGAWAEPATYGVQVSYEY